MKAYTRIQRSWIDFLLAGCASSLTVLSLGISLSYAALGYVFVAMICVGSFVSFLLHAKYRGVWFDRIGLILYVLLAFASPFVAYNLNLHLPAEGFPRELLFSAAPLTWMLALGSLATWRDQTLLFQCVPCIAIFGLVGAFNTFDGATIMFFAFLFCASILYARSHQRAMLERAARSGYPKLEAIHGGPWRYMAGPEWGLISAAVVIVLSAIGAPIIQLSVRQVSGVVAIRPPQVQPPSPTANPAATSMGENRRIGLGPAGRLSDRELFRVKTPEPRYLRVGAYNIYTNGLWSKGTLGPARGFGSGAPRGPTSFPYIYQDTLSKNFETVPFWIKFTGGTLTKLPIPTPFGGMDRQRAFEVLGDGSVNVARVFDPEVSLRGIYYKLKPETEYSDGPPVTETVERYFDLGVTPIEIIELAREVSSNGKTSREKAELIKQEIERRSKYNLNAEGAPEGEDPLKWFLLGPIREGYCDLFASAMVIMARAVEIPARYVVGYYPVDNEVDREGYYVFREANAHAWAELYFEGVGWIPFDPTEGASQVPGGERGRARDTRPFYESESFWRALQVGGGVVLVSLIAWLVVTRRNSLTSEQIIAAKLFEAFDRHTQALEVASGKPRWVNESPDEHFNRVESSLGAIRDDAGAATALFATAFYGPKRISSEETLALFESSEKLRKAANGVAKARKRA